MADTDYNDYGILAGNQVTANSGTSNILGDLGSNLSVAGTGAISVSGQTNIGADISNALTNAQDDYLGFMTVPPTVSYSVSDIGGMTFTPGNIQFTNTGPITLGANPGYNTINLNGAGFYLFQIPYADFSTLTSTASVAINLTGGAAASSILWIINGDLTLQSVGSFTTSFLGTVLCQGNIIMGNNSTNIGSLCAFNSTGNATLNNNNITATAVQRPRDVSSTGYVNLESSLADNEAVSIVASSNYGGIDISAGLGGIAVNTTNGISIQAAAATNLTTLNGDLTLQATAGVIDIDGGSGMNIGNAITATPINIGTSSYAKNITIGNATGTTSVNIDVGTVGFNVNTTNGPVSLNSTGSVSNFTATSTADGQNLTIAQLGATDSSVLIESQGTGAAAINLQTNNGGITVETSAVDSGGITIATAYTSNSEILLTSGPGSGGSISLESGSGSIIANAYNGGVIGIGNNNASSILIGTAGPSTVTIGNAVDTTSVVLSAGTGGITIGDDANDGIIQIGNVANAKMITIGNNTGVSQLLERFGTGGLVLNQSPPTSLADASVVLTVAQLLTRLFTITPTAADILTLDTASNIVAAISGAQINDSFDFTIINLATSQSISVAPDTSGTLVGNDTILGSTSGTFRLQLTSISSPAYIVYRIS